MAQAGPMIGLRGEDEIAARVAALAEDAAAAPLPGDEAAALDDLLRIEGRLSGAVAPLRAVAARLPSLAPAVDRLAARVQALAEAGGGPGGGGVCRKPRAHDAGILRRICLQLPRGGRHAAGGQRRAL
jgi:hypothetical protein